MLEFMHDVVSGPRGLELVFVLSLIAMWVGVVQENPSIRALAVSPILTLIVLVLVAILGSLVVDPLTKPLGRFGDAMGWLICAVLCVLASHRVGLWAGKFEATQAAAEGETRHRRGAVVSAAASAPDRRWWFGAGRPRPRPQGVAPTLAGVSVALEDETKHFKIIGSTGTGKSTAIRELLSAALKRGDRAIIADPDGSYLDIFYDTARGDVILNPFEPDALKWDLFGEIIHPYDVEQLARSLIPDVGGDDRIWSEYARTFFSAVTQQLIRAGAKDDRTLHRLIRSADEEELHRLLAGTAAGPFLREGSEKMFGSLRSVASNAVRVLEHTIEQQSRPFSVRQWVREGAAIGGKGGVLFLPYRASQIASLRSVISAWMRLGIFEAMDRPAGDQRLWFIVDELDALGAIDGLKDALSRLRKFGGRCVLGFQSIAQVSGTYGREVADTVVENCGNTLILRCSASERGGTSEFASKLIGQREVVHTTASRTHNPAAWLATTTTSQQIRIEPAVMASEIERLPDLAGFLKLASRPDWQRVQLTPVHYPEIARIREPQAASSSAAPLKPVVEPLGGAELRD
ncbi:MAG TPA: type IV secretion system DNA-binding domain-containing protein [Steroidobacteraceae bacterium]|nr:type IV secretion system DNA-binding domain-containing protein [Steroidobacteraceae bacterium]